MQRGVLLRCYWFVPVWLLFSVQSGSLGQAPALHEGGEGPGQGEHAEPEPVAGPGAGETIAAYRVLDGWVRSWSVPSEARAIDPAGVNGASVTLRLAGRVVGRGARVSDDGAGTSIWQSAGAARIEAASRLPVDEGTREGGSAPEFAPVLMIDMEVAGPLIPLVGETFGAAAAALSPGVDGVATRRGDRFEAVFPGTMLMLGIAPAEALRSTATALGLPFKELGELRTEGDVACYRFRTRHLAQTAPGSEPVFLYRGGRTVSLREVNGAALRDAAKKIAMHLMTHEWNGEEAHGMMGSYRLVANTYEPMIAPPFEQALTALSLARFVRTPGIDEGTRTVVRSFIGRLLARVAKVEPDEADPLATPESAALVAAALEEARRAGAALDGSDELRGAALERLGAMYTVEGGWSPAVGSSVRSLAAFAMAQTALAEDADPAERVRASAAVRSIFRETEAGRLTAEMPWLGWAELMLAEEADVAAAQALVAMRELAAKHQLGPADLDDGWIDMEGGIVFTRGRTPIPTWQTFRPMAFAAMALGHPQLTPKSELPTQAVMLQRSLRFGLELMVRPEHLHMFPDGIRALGGVRPAPWDNTASVDASCLVLLTICESLRSFEKRASRP